MVDLVDDDVGATFILYGLVLFFGMFPLQGKKYFTLPESDSRFQSMLPCCIRGRGVGRQGGDLGNFSWGGSVFLALWGGEKV